MIGATDWEGVFKKLTLIYSLGIVAVTSFACLLVAIHFAVQFLSR